MALSRKGAAQQGVALVHRRNLAERLRDARAAFERTAESFDAFRKQADVLAKARMTDKAAEAVIEKSLDYVLGALDVDGAAVLAAAMDKTEKNPAARKLAKRDEARERISGLLRRELKDAGAKLVNGWLLSQAIGEWIDTRPKYIGTDGEKAEARFGNLLVGDAADARAYVFETVMAATAQ